MADITLCDSAAACRAGLRCYRNPAAEGGAQPSPVRQASADWHPESGPGCPGFIDLGARPPLMVSPSNHEGRNPVPDAGHPYGLEHQEPDHG